MTDTAKRSRKVQRSDAAFPSWRTYGAVTVQLLSRGKRELSDGGGGAEKDGRESSYVRVSPEKFISSGEPSVKLVLKKVNDYRGSSAVSDAQELDYKFHNYERMLFLALASQYY